MFLEKTIVKKKLPKNNTPTLKTFKTLKKYCIKLLLKKSLTSNKTHEKNYKKIVKYTITIRYYKTNTSITASEINGEPFFFYISQPNIIKKKLNRKSNIKNLIKNLTNNCPFILNKPIALHLINTGYSKKQIVKSFDKFFILTLKIFNINPHNGCRPSKKKRIKRRTKKFFTFKNKKTNKLFLKTVKSTFKNYKKLIFKN